MAIQTAEVTVSFTSATTGEHRVCWRVRNASDPATGEYDCSTLINCDAEDTCNTLISTQVDTNSCDGELLIEGYVQPTCYEEATTVGRVPFSESFFPDPDCKRYEVTCTDLVNCPAWNVGLDCESNPRSLANGELVPGQTIALCLESLTDPVPAEYSLIQEGCCTGECKTYVITNNSGANASLTYYECQLGEEASVLLADTDSVDICAVQGSVLLAGGPNPDVTIVEGADCLPIET